MDYKYIEQLIDRYFNCETSFAEERILKAFFSQSDVPEDLRKYQDFFNYEDEAREEGLGEDFDQRILQRLHQDDDATAVRVKVKKMSFARRLRPLGRAAAAVAIVVLVGGSIHRAYVRNTFEPINQYGANTADNEISTGEEISPNSLIKEGQKMAITMDSLSQVSTAE